MQMYEQSYIEIRIPLIKVLQNNIEATFNLPENRLRNSFWFRIQIFCRSRAVRYENFRYCTLGKFYRWVLSIYWHLGFVIREEYFQCKEYRLEK